jgi:hypothetical protein
MRAMEIELSGGRGMLSDSTYDRLMTDCDNIGQKSKSWCAQGDKSYCGITFGPCEENPASNTQERYRAIQQNLRKKCQFGGLKSP